jgi:nitrogen fixation NifU-like protein
MTTAVAYSAEVIRRCQELPRAGGWPEDDPRVGTGVVGSLDAGTMTRVQLRLAADGERVEDARFKVFGCSAAIASASLAADRIAGAPVSAAQALDAGELAAALELPDEKRAMAGHAVAAVQAALDDWARKNRVQRPGAGGWRLGLHHD